MCGIAGILSSVIVDTSDCIRFIDALYHRGPDGRGVYFEKENGLFLGHRALRILDLSETGKQPMHSADGRYVIVFNGEIYNFLELKEELKSKGHSFRSQSDTEVILNAYKEWKEDCQQKFNGMWAFAIWDTREKKLFLSRDRFGVKPLYIYQKNGIFAFASEIKAFQALSFIDLSFDLQKVADTIEDPLLLEPSEETIYQNIRKIPAGHCLTITSERCAPSRPWWNTLSHIDPITKNWEEEVGRFRELFFDACAIRMRSDVSIGTALSGGLDSSSILCSIFQLGKNTHQRWPDSWQKSFTAVFPNSSHDELEYAQAASEATQSQSFYHTITPQDLMDGLDQALYSIEDIFDPPIGPWLLYREYRKRQVTISIDGHGADELLCGYHHQFERAFLESFFPYPQIGRLKNLWPLMTQMYAVHSDRKTPEMMIRLAKTGLQSLFQNSNSFPYQALKKIYWGKFSESAGFGRYGWLNLQPSSFNPVISALHKTKEFKNLSYLNQILYLDFHCRTLPSILRNFDRCSMAHGVEIRAPFMDWRLVSLAFSLPSEAKVGVLGSKNILRASMEGILPEKIRLRKSKIGFASPLNQWIANHLKEYILDIVRGRSFQESTIWNGPKISADLEQALEKKDFFAFRKAWEFILADKLMASFKNKAHFARESVEV